MPDKFHRPTEPSHALYHDVLCGNIASVHRAIRQSPELVQGQPVVAGAWSHGGRRCGAQDDVIVCLQLLAVHGADFSLLGAGTYDSAFKALPRAAALLFELGAKAERCDGDNSTGLHYMAAIGNRSACEVLLKHGADLDAKNDSNETPLDIAKQHNLPRMVRFLSCRGAEPVAERHDRFVYSPNEKPVDSADRRFRGEVTWYRADRGYGYLRDSLHEGTNFGQPDAPNVYGELFFDRANDMVGKEPNAVEEGTPLTFAIAVDEFGLRATNVEFSSIDLRKPTT